jgi:hypothetical protein
MLDVAFGKDTANKMRAYAQRLAAMDGRIDPTNLTADNFMRRIDTYLKGKEQHETMLKSNFVKMLTGRTELDRSDALHYIMADPNRVTEARKFYGDTSPEWQQIKQEAMLTFLKGSMQPGVGVLDNVLQPGVLSGQLNKINPRVMDELFGADVGKSLRELGRVIDFVSAPPLTKGAKTEGGMAGALAAGALMFHPLRHLGAIAQLATLGHLYRSKPFLEWLALGYQGDTTAMRNAYRIIQSLAYVYEPIARGGRSPTAAIQGILNPQAPPGGTPDTSGVPPPPPDQGGQPPPPPPGQ